MLFHPHTPTADYSLWFQWMIHKYLLHDCVNSDKSFDFSVPQFQQHREISLNEIQRYENAYNICRARKSTWPLVFVTHGQEISNNAQEVPSALLTCISTDPGASSVPKSLLSGNTIVLIQRDQGEELLDGLVSSPKPLPAHVSALRREVRVKRPVGKRPNVTMGL